MKLLLTLAGASVALGGTALVVWTLFAFDRELRCLIRGVHRNPRPYLGGFRCAECLAVGATLAEMGYENSGHVSLLRKLYSREGSAITRTDGWEATRRGW